MDTSLVTDLDTLVRAIVLTMRPKLNSAIAWVRAVEAADECMEHLKARIATGDTGAGRVLDLVVKAASKTGRHGGCAGIKRFLAEEVYEAYIG